MILACTSTEKYNVESDTAHMILTLSVNTSVILAGVPVKMCQYRCPQPSQYKDQLTQVLDTTWCHASSSHPEGV